MIEREHLVDLILMDMIFLLLRITPLLTFRPLEVRRREGQRVTVLARNHRILLPFGATDQTVGAIVGHLGGYDDIPVGGSFHRVEVLHVILHAISAWYTPFQRLKVDPSRVVVEENASFSDVGGECDLVVDQPQQISLHNTLSKRMKFHFGISSSSMSRHIIETGKTAIRFCLKQGRSAR